MPARRLPISVGLRFQILERDDFTCQYCGAQAPDAQLVIDHAVPVSLGGSNDPDNLVTSCVRCNQGKSDKTAFPIAWRTPTTITKYQEIAESYMRDIQWEVTSTYGSDFRPPHAVLTSLLYRYNCSAVEAGVYAIARDSWSRGVTPNVGGYRYVSAVIRHMRRQRMAEHARAIREKQGEN